MNRILSQNNHVNKIIIFDTMLYFTKYKQQYTTGVHNFQYVVNIVFVLYTELLLHSFQIGEVNLYPYLYQYCQEILCQVTFVRLNRLEYQ